jgi:hypothetical protein
MVVERRWSSPASADQIAALYPEILQLERAYAATNAAQQRGRQ